MPSNVALVVFCGFIVWLFVAHRGRSEALSPALWIPLVWTFILGSRPVSTWFGSGGSEETADDYLEGSPFDRTIFLLLIVAGIGVLYRRRANWQRIISQNKWVFLYFFYLGVSVLWSDYLFTAFKRWIKDFGNVIMVLVILSEADAISAVKAMFSRCIYFLIPLSVLLIKYYPELGRAYNRWTGEAFYTGLTTNKNILGMTLFVCALFLFWILIDLVRTKGEKKLQFVRIMNCVLLAALTCWLLYMARSSTAVTCSVIGAAIILGLQFSPIRKKVGSLGFYSIATFALLAFLHAAFNLGDLFVQIVGRDLTFTGRTEIWELVLREKTNPLIGVGFYSFWLGDRSERLSQGYYYHLNEAHNGYLETYLNNGLIGVALLAMVLISAARRIKPYVLVGQNYGALRLALLIGTIIYGMTEAVFNRLVIIWFVLLLSSMEYPRPRRRIIERPAEVVEADQDQSGDPNATVDAPIRDPEPTARTITAQIAYATV